MNNEPTPMPKAQCSVVHVMCPNSSVLTNQGTDAQVLYTNPHFLETSTSSEVKCSDGDANQTDPEQAHVTEDENEHKSDVSSIASSTFAISESFYLPSNTEESDKNRMPTLAEMGCKGANFEGWNLVVQPPKVRHAVLYLYMVQENIKPDVQIKIGSMCFNCHMLVLQCYSGFFWERNSAAIIELPAEYVSPSTYIIIYNWMLCDSPKLQLKSIVSVFNAATFLRIDDLLNQCWFYFDHTEIFSEAVAFGIYLQAQHYKLLKLAHLMLARIGRYFLQLVASDDFLHIDVSDIMELLSSNAIGVNSEVEVFMAALRWLNYEWPKRAAHLSSVMRCVRFSLMPPWFLVPLKDNYEGNQLDHILKNHEVQVSIDSGIAYSTMVISYGSNREICTNFLKRLNLTTPLERVWTYDTNCKHHHRLACLHTTPLTYTKFLEYLSYLNSRSPEYWKSICLEKHLKMEPKCCNFFRICTKDDDDGEGES